MKQPLLALHRAISLVFAALWMVQAASGVFLVFHRDIQDWMQPETTQPLDIVRLGDSIERLDARNAHDSVSSVVLTSQSHRHYEVTLESPSGAAEIVRVDGEGRSLRSYPRDAVLGGSGAYMLANRLHRNLLADQLGGWIVGISGVLLLSNLLVGLKMAWPTAGRWRRALLPRRAASAGATVYGTHRAVGLWLAIPTLVTIGCGVLLAFEQGTARAIGASPVVPPRIEATADGRSVGPQKAISAALQIFPGAEFSALLFPSDSRPIYQVFVRQPGELRQTYGATRVYVNARTAEIAGVRDALAAPRADRSMSALFPIHTGQAGGWLGRIVVLLIGLWLVAMIGMGLVLFATRRNATQQRSTLASEIHDGRKAT